MTIASIVLLAICVATLVFQTILTVRMMTICNVLDELILKHSEKTQGVVSSMKNSLNVFSDIINDLDMMRKTLGKNIDVNHQDTIRSQGEIKNALGAVMKEIRGKK